MELSKTPTLKSYFSSEVYFLCGQSTAIWHYGRWHVLWRHFYQKSTVMYCIFSCAPDSGLRDRPPALVAILHSSVLEVTKIKCWTCGFEAGDTFKVRQLDIFDWVPKWILKLCFSRIKTSFLRVDKAIVKQTFSITIAILKCHFSRVEVKMPLFLECHDIYSFLLSTNYEIMETFFTLWEPHLWLIQ